MDDSRAHIEIGVDTMARRAAVERAEQDCRILVLGDFGGAARRLPLAQRVVHRIDRDGIDAAVAAVAPVARLAIDPSAGTEDIAFHELDDFHPDHLLARAPSLVQLRQLRTAVESGGRSTSDSPPSPATSAPPAGGSLLDRILDRDPTPDIPHAAAADANDVDEFVRRAVRGHVTHATDPAQHALVAQVDDALAATLRVMLHHRDFQALEAAWRGLDLLARRAEADGESVAIGLLDVAPDELVRGVAGTNAVDNAALVRHLTVDGASPAWTVVVAVHAFGPRDVEHLSDVATFAATTRTPWLTAASSTFVGASTFAGNADADDWEAPALEGWSALRKRPQARFVALAAPRVLLRTPYGAADNAIDAMAFEEFPVGAATHESFLWGNPAYLAALILAASPDTGATASASGTIAGLPLHIMTSSGSSEALPCAEVALTQRSAAHMLGLGLTPLMAQRDGDTVRIPRLQSISDPPSPLALADVR